MVNDNQTLLVGWLLCHLLTFVISDYIGFCTIFDFHIFDVHIYAVTSYTYLCVNSLFCLEA